jgi:hypothetical protein
MRNNERCHQHVLRAVIMFGISRRPLVLQRDRPYISEQGERSSNDEECITADDLPLGRAPLDLSSIYISGLTRVRPEVRI